MTDCKMPVGVEDGTITNQQMTASSSYGHYDASNGRLNNKPSRDSTGKLVWGGWCTDKLDSHQFLQVIVVKIILYLFSFREDLFQRQMDWYTAILNIINDRLSTGQEIHPLRLLINYILLSRLSESILILVFLWYKTRKFSRYMYRRRLAINRPH